jgi:hypothetical protein
VQLVLCVKALAKAVKVWCEAWPVPLAVAQYLLYNTEVTCCSRPSFSIKVHKHFPS